MTRYFRNLGQLVRYKNSFLPGIERSDSQIRLARHRVASNKLITARTSSDDVSCLGVKKRWNGESFDS